MSKYQIGDLLQTAKENRDHTGCLISTYPKGTSCEVIEISHILNTSLDYDVYTVELPNGETNKYCSDWLEYKTNVRTNAQYCRIFRNEKLVEHLLSLKCCDCGERSDAIGWKCRWECTCKAGINRWLNSPISDREKI